MQLIEAYNGECINADKVVLLRRVDALDRRGKEYKIIAETGYQNFMIYEDDSKDEVEAVWGTMIAMLADGAAIVSVSGIINYLAENVQTEA